MLKLLSLFSGIGAFEKALENIGEPFEVVRYCEIDKYASKAYSLIHNLDENLNLKDVCTVKTEELPKDIDLCTYGFPCQDISIAGKQKGFQDEEGDLTRSGLFFEALYVIEQTKPKVAIAENVKALTSKKFAAEFKIVLDCLNEAGYRNYWAVLNAKDYGIPQNRERVFIISIRNDLDHGFQFPKKYELKLRLKDLLEETVDEKYYLPDKMLQGFLNTVVDNSPTIQRFDVPQTVSVRKYEVNKEKLVKTLRHQKKVCGWSNKELAKELELPVTTVEHWFRTDDGFAIPDPEIWEDVKWLLEMDDIDDFDEAIMTFEERDGVYEKAERCYHENGISPTITAAMGKNEKIIIDGCIQIGSLNRKKYHEFSNRVYSPDGCARTLMGEGGNSNDKAGQYLMPNLKIRRLTPKECFRLMGFADEDCDILVANKISNTQLYKLAGNSIVVDVLEEIFVELLNQYEDVFPMR